MGKVKDGRWCVENDLLRGLLTYGDDTSNVLGLEGNWSFGQDFAIVKGLLTWLVRRALNIERLPWMADWPYAFVPYSTRRLDGALKYFIENPTEVDAACAELKMIYEHTQEHFSSKSQSFIRLGRGYQNDAERHYSFGIYANTLLRQADAARILGVKEIDVPHDVITSWAVSCNYTSCVAGVEMGIPASDILCTADTLAPRKGAKGNHAIEPGEWLVINRRLDGLMALPAADIQALRGHWVEPVTLEEAQTVLETRIPAVRREEHLYCHSLREPRSKQSLRSRASRAWDVLINRYH